MVVFLLFLLIAALLSIFILNGFSFHSDGPLSKGLYGGRLKKRKILRKKCKKEIKNDDLKLKLCFAKAVESTLHKGSRKHTNVKKRIEKMERRIARRDGINN